MATEEPAAIPGNPAGFIRALQAAGEGPTAGLQMFRDAGGKIQDSRWFGLYRQVADTLEATPGALGLDPFSLPAPHEYVPWDLGPGDQFMTQVDVQLMNTADGTFVTKPATYVTDEPHTPEEAEDWAIAKFDPLNTGSPFSQTIMGALTVTVAQT